MSENNEDLERQVIPRWRSFASSAMFGELRPLQIRDPGAFNEGMLQDAIEEWNATPTLTIGSEVVSLAFTIGCGSSVRDIAAFVVSDPRAKSDARQIAEQCLLGVDAPANEALWKDDLHPDFASLNTQIGRTKGRVRKYARNPVVWADLALLYTIRGQRPQATQAMAVAASLAPNNRFVLRSECRMHLHYGDVDRALFVLRAADRTKEDPWLLAAEMAVSTVRQTPARFAKHAVKVVGMQSFSPFHLSELNAAIGTIEAKAGNIRKARRFCEAAVTEPSENSVAQIAWLGRQVDSSLGALNEGPVAESHEASAWKHRCSGDWLQALDHAELWQQEQPFSSRPAIMGSYIASTALEQFQVAAHVIEKALPSNPCDVTLLNNLAFAYAKMNNMIDAERALLRANQLPANTRTSICLQATRGLIAFRRGEQSQGRIYYRQAIRHAAGASLDVYQGVATIYLAIEECRIRSKQAGKAVKEANAWVARLPAEIRNLFEAKLKAASINIAV